jgi:hypothetical protein
MRMPTFQFLSGFVLTAALAGCSSQVDDQSMYLTGTEEYAVTLANGAPGCTNPKKVLICHIPPGNPDNAHDICVGHQAVAPHQEHHGDTIGACAPGGGDGGDVDAGTGGGGETPDAGGGGGTDPGTDGGDGTPTPTPIN